MEMKDGKRGVPAEFGASLTLLLDSAMPLVSEGMETISVVSASTKGWMFRTVIEVLERPPTDRRGE